MNNNFWIEFFHLFFKFIIISNIGVYIFNFFKHTFRYF